MGGYQAASRYDLTTDERPEQLLGQATIAQACILPDREIGWRMNQLSIRSPLQVYRFIRAASHT